MTAPLDDERGFPLDGFDWKADAIGCWALGIDIAREMVRRGEPVPAFYLSEKPDPDKPATAAGGLL